MLTDFKRNCMGTVDFTAQFKGMRKPQGFTVYPIGGSTAPDRLKVQSDTRIGWIVLATGEVIMSAPHASGAFNNHLAEAKHIDTLDAQSLLMLKAQVAATTGSAVGNRGVVTDNGGALAVLGAV